MVNFFRNSSPVQIIFLLLLLLLIRVPILVLGLPLTLPELNWMLIGERLHQGHSLYTGIWDTISPLSAVVYWFIDWQFGRSQLAYQILALLLTGGQAILFNHIINKNQLYPERNYLSGLFYLVFANLSFDFYTLSPVLMATTFILLALDKLFIQVDQRNSEDRVFESGFYLAVATLFYLPTGLFILFALFALLFFGSSDFRQYFLLIFGFVFPLSLTALCFYLLGSYEAFVEQYVMSIFTTEHQYFINLQTLLLLFVIPALVAFLGLSKVIGSMRYINYQRRCQQIMVVYLITVAVYLVLTPQLSPSELMVAIPGLAFFAPPYFFSTDRKWVAEAVFGGVFAFALFMHYASVFSGVPAHNLVGLSSMQVQPLPSASYPSDKKILVLGDNLSAYQQNRIATPYLNWRLSRQELLNLDSYRSVVNIYHNFEKDLPEVIIDSQNIVPTLFSRIPALERRYQAGSAKGVYQRRQ